MPPTTECNNCGGPTLRFVGGTWLGHPVLYMGLDPLTGYALKYQFCDAECMLEWLREVLGE